MMRDIIGMLLVFVSVILVHIAWCRMRPRHQLGVVSFCWIALAGLVLYLTVGIPSGKVDTKGFLFSVWSAPLKLSAVVMYFLLIPTYLIFYFSVRLESPSKAIIILAKKSGEASYDDFAQYVTDNRFLMTRLQDLLDHNCIRLENGIYRLTTHGAMIANLLNIYEKIFGRGMGG